jgi:hypothetical protein
LIIGDQALFLDGGPVVVGEGCRDTDVTVEKIDLGQLWLGDEACLLFMRFWAGAPWSGRT